MFIFKNPFRAEGWSMKGLHLQRKQENEETYSTEG